MVAVDVLTAYPARFDRPISPVMTRNEPRTKNKTLWLKADASLGWYR